VYGRRRRGGLVGAGLALLLAHAAFAAARHPLNDKNRMLNDTGRTSLSSTTVTVAQAQAEAQGAAEDESAVAVLAGEQLVDSVVTGPARHSAGVNAITTRGRKHGYNRHE
jgi:hypothetical protein